MRLNLNATFVTAIWQEENETVFLLPLVFFSCEQKNSSDNNGPSWEERRIVGSETIEGYEGITYLWIKRDGNPVWEMTDAYVDGFTYQNVRRVLRKSSMHSNGTDTSPQLTE